MDWWRIYEVMAAYHFGVFITRADAANSGRPGANWAVATVMAAAWPVALVLETGFRWGRRSKDKIGTQR